MAEDTGQESGQGQGQGQEPGQQQREGQGQEPGGGGFTPQGFDPASLPDEARAYVERLQQDARAARTEAAEQRKKVAAEQERIRQASMTDEQRRQAEADALRRENEALKEQARTAGLQAAVTSEATALRFHSPRAALAMLDRSAIEYDADGKPTNLRTLLEAVARDEPYLVKRQGPGGGGEGRGRQQGSTRGMNDLIRERMGR